ncbi:MAG: hypothetical protein GWM90_19690 [Gemmatimonadetes bacterium]|nr:hypothetical protein [Gemmatimonadota bacterium]NIQ56653.1 hypothetical protein [Gemmatimonadota bacterium]NIU76842.1 hypothetical protein [Gammaproteobacteria bacterium]NIX46227.1 hypothetical protein [Gemmatimonadota bacterium]NIY10559.1 hypothetical protein [Gemmatimonadota bacterium]
MGVFEFVIILVLISAFGKGAAVIGGPLADLIRETAGERRARRKAIEEGRRADPALVDELETRLLRIEERLDFLEQLRAPSTRPGLSRGPDREP